MATAFSGGSGGGRFVTGVRAVWRRCAQAAVPAAGAAVPPPASLRRRQPPSGPRRSPLGGLRQRRGGSCRGRRRCEAGGAAARARLRLLCSPPPPPPLQPPLAALPADGGAADGCCRSPFSVPGWAAVEPGGPSRSLVPGTRLAFQSRAAGDLPLFPVPQAVAAVEWLGVSGAHKTAWARSS